MIALVAGTAVLVGVAVAIYVVLKDRCASPAARTGCVVAADCATSPLGRACLPGGTCGCTSPADCVLGGTCGANGKCVAPPAACVGRAAPLAGATCAVGMPTQGSKLMRKNLYMQYFAREPTTSDARAGQIDRASGNRLEWLNQQTDAMGQGDMVIFSNDFLNFDSAYMAKLKGALDRGASVYLVISRFLDWGCAYPMNLQEQQNPANCYEDAKRGNPWNRGALPDNNNCQWLETISQNSDLVSDPHFYWIDQQEGGAGACAALASKPGIQTPNVTAQARYTADGLGRSRTDVLNPHRKVVSFYSQSRGVGSVYRGSANTQSDTSGTGGVREVGWGITGALGDAFMQYNLQQDRDTFAFLFPRGQPGDASYVPDYGYAISSNIVGMNPAIDQSGIDVVARMGALMLRPGTYPALPITVQLNWSTPDFSQLDALGQTTPWVSGVDPKVDIYMGLSPPPGGAQMPQFDDAADVYGNLKGTPGAPTDAGFAADAAKIQARTGKLWWAADPAVPQAWGSPGAQWAGSCLVRMLQSAKTNGSAYVKSSIYDDFVSSFRPCAGDEGLNWNDNLGSTGYDTSDTDPTRDARLVSPLPNCPVAMPDKDAWHNSLEASVMRALWDFLQTGGQLMNLVGTPLNVPDATGTGVAPLNGYALLQFNKVPAALQYPGGAGKNTWWRAYSVDRGAFCAAEGSTSSSKFCKSHEKLWFSDRDVVISSGHPTRGYYEDFVGANDDILFENAFGLVDVYNNMFARLWTANSVGPMGTPGYNGTGPTNPNWGTWSSATPSATWTPPLGPDGNPSYLAPLDRGLCAACFSTAAPTGYCSSSNSTPGHAAACYYNTVT